MGKRVVVTGLDIISPVGIGKDSFWENLQNGVSGIKPISLFDVTNDSSKKAGEITDFDAKEFLGKKGIRHFDRTSLLATAASCICVKDAGLGDVYREEDFGIVIGSTFGSIDSISAFDQEALNEGPNYVNPMDFPNTVINAPASRASIFCQAKGPNTTISTGESSGVDAMMYATDFLRLGRAKVVMVGGVYGLTSNVFWGACRAGVLSGSRNAGNDVEICAPFDKRRNGIVMGEGAALLILERLEDAQARGARIYAEVKGYGTSFNPNWGESEDLSGGIRANLIALESAGLGPEDISLIYANANSSPNGDRMETAVIKESFGNHAKKIPVSAIKSMTGDCLDASGAMQCVAAVMSINTGTIPPTINYKEADPECDLDYVPNEKRQADADAEIEHVLVESYSYTGNCSSLILSKFS
ncbi:MAG: beta-ketoacyl-[acyl-carrier-protein] synthase family protein [Planctomycetota bacterium]|jgi:3-oxoacyl-[acyl-carrier-protein] synthase II